MLIIFLLLSLSVIGCNNDENSQRTDEFLFKNPQYKLQVQGDRIYNKYDLDKWRKDGNGNVTAYSFYGEVKSNSIIGLYIDDKLISEIMLSKEWQKFPETNIFMKETWSGNIRFRKTNKSVEIKKTKKQEIKKEKEKIKMNLTLGTWVLLVIVMLVVAKIAHKISLKTIFKPTKKTVNHVKKEWDES